MRKLTLDEKITIKGILKDHFNINLPKIDMKNAVHLWYKVFGSPISQYYKVKVKHRDRKIKIRENQKFPEYLKYYPQYKNLYKKFKKGMFTGKGKYTELIKDGDVVRTKRLGVCVAQIQGNYNSYQIKDGKCVNTDKDNKGFLMSLETGENFRYRWSKIELLSSESSGFFETSESPGYFEDGGNN